MSLSTNAFLQHLDQQHEQIQAVIHELDECQIAFNARYDQFRLQHDAQLDHLTEQLMDALERLPPGAQHDIEARAVVERDALNERRAELRETLLPAAQAEADQLLQKAQDELARVRALNPTLDAKEERLKAIQARLRSELETLNEEIRDKGRGLGVVTHFLEVHRADKQRAHVLGRLEIIAESLRDLRQEWARTRIEAASLQGELQSQWQAKSLEVARLQEELDSLDDDTRREALAWRRAVSHVLDNLQTPIDGAPATLQPALARMVELNEQTDDYHASLAGTAGLIATLTGIQSGLAAIRRSVEGLQHEQEMHSAYLKPLSFELPAAARAFEGRWEPLAKRMADEKAVASHPKDFLSAVAPLQEEMLSVAQIEQVFEAYGQTIEAATQGW
jgi:chromosome segregation ATPase